MDKVLALDSKTIQYFKLKKMSKQSYNFGWYLKKCNGPVFLLYPCSSTYRKKCLPFIDNHCLRLEGQGFGFLDSRCEKVHNYIP